MTTVTVDKELVVKKLTLEFDDKEAKRFQTFLNDVIDMAHENSLRARYANELRHDINAKLTR